MRHGNNIWAPPAYNGIGQASVPSGYRDQSFDYVLDVTIGANLTVNEQLAIQNDADFCWRALVIQLFTGPFAVKFTDSDWYALSNVPIVNANLVGTPSTPYPILPEIILPAGGRIGVDITDLSGAQNTIQILFRGAKRYAMV